MSNRLFQRIVHQMRESIDRVLGVVDETATVIACSDLTKIGETFEYMMLGMGDVSDVFVRDHYTFKPFGNVAKPEYAVFVEALMRLLRNSATSCPYLWPASNSTMTKSMTAATLSKCHLTTFCPVTFISKPGNCILTSMLSGPADSNCLCQRYFCL